MNNFFVTLAEYCLLLLFCALSTAIALFALFLLYRLNKCRNFNAAPSLIVYLSSLGVCCAALTVQYALLTLSLLDVFSSALSPTQFIFWTGLVPGSLIPATPICVFFLSADRLLIILLPSIYNMKSWIKRSLARSSVLSVVALFGTNLGVNLAERPATEHPECISFGCLTSDASRLIYAVNRFAVALPNFLAGISFLAALFAFRRRLNGINGPITIVQNTNNTRNSTQQNGTVTNLNTKMATVNTDSRKMSDRLIFYCVLFELLLDLLPNFINLILTAFDFNISVYVGAFRSMTYASCAFCSVMAHTSILWDIFKSNNVSVPANKTFRLEQKTTFRTKTHNISSRPFKSHEHGLRTIGNRTNSLSNNRNHIRIVPTNGSRKLSN
ncbi:hypothetical protein niasHT_019464 [Heterodera trifolii]|uniref:G-protein coupled receptors family 1 profile domain-containing protein n=1 Tax=Heterodera trifolii TaxID=157864 RepID=A0ABD2KW33_9BILA